MDCVVDFTQKRRQKDHLSLLIVRVLGAVQGSRRFKLAEDPHEQQGGLKAKLLDGTAQDTDMMPAEHQCFSLYTLRSGAQELLNLHLQLVDGCTRRLSRHLDG